MVTINGLLNLWIIAKQQLRTTDYGLRTTDIALDPFDLRLGICNLWYSFPGKGQPPTTTTDYGYHCNGPTETDDWEFAMITTTTSSSDVRWTLFDRWCDGFDTSSPGKGQLPTVTTSSDVQWTLIDRRCGEIGPSSTFAKLRWSFSIDDSGVGIKHPSPKWRHGSYAKTKQTDCGWIQ